MSKVNNSSSHHTQATQLEQHTQTLHHTQQTQRSQKLQRVKMQRTKVLRNKLAASFALRKKWQAQHAMAGRGAMSQKVSTMFGARPDRSAFAGKQMRLRGKDKEKEVKDGRVPEHEKEHEKERLEHPHERDPQTQREKEREKEKEKEKERQQQQQSGKDERKDGESSSQQQQQPQQQQQQQGDTRRDAQNDDNQQQQRRQPREGDSEGGGGKKFAVSRRKVGVAVKVPENFQALGVKLKDAPPAEMSRVLLQTFAKVVLRQASKIENGLALAPLMALSATSPAALRRSAARMQAHIASATYAQNSRSTSPGAQAKASASVGILNHTADLTQARQRFDVSYSLDDQSIMSVRQLLIDTMASMPTLVASGGVATASENSPEVRVAPATPAAGS